MNYRAVCTLIISASVIQFVFNGHGLSEDKSAKTEAEKIADTIRRKAEISEKAEGTQDKVKDEVKVSTGDNGQPVVEQVGEASFYGQGFQGKKTASGEK